MFGSYKASEMTMATLKTLENTRVAVGSSISQTSMTGGIAHSPFQTLYFE